MTTPKRTTQMTIRLEADLARAVLEAQRRTGKPRATVIVDAARKVLLPSEDASPERQLQDLANRVMSRITALERGLGGDLFQTRELLALGIRAYFNHTPAIPDTERDAASLSGKARFARLLELLDRNLEHGMSILDETEKTNER